LSFIKTCHAKLFHSNKSFRVIFNPFLNYQRTWNENTFSRIFKINTSTKTQRPVLPPGLLLPECVFSLISILAFLQTNGILFCLDLALYQYLSFCTSFRENWVFLFSLIFSLLKTEWKRKRLQTKRRTFFYN